LIQQLEAITKAAFVCLATCEELTRFVTRFRKCRSTLQNHKDRLARLIKELMCGDILRQIQERPGWHNDMDANRERLTSPSLWLAFLLPLISYPRGNFFTRPVLKRADPQRRVRQWARGAGLSDKNSNHRMRL